jgi:hypothetical protein
MIELDQILRARQAVPRELVKILFSGLEAQQPQLVAFGRHGEHGDDVQLALAGKDGGSADRGRPVKGIPMYPAVVPGPSPLPAASAGRSASGPGGPGVST